MDQLVLDFESSVSVRTRRARKRAAGQEMLPMFAITPVSIDVHMTSDGTPVATVTGNPEEGEEMLSRLVGATVREGRRRHRIEPDRLDRLIGVRPPAQITLDAACLALANAIWAQKLGLAPLKVTRDSRRLTAASRGWPGQMAVRDAPWPVIEAAIRMGLPVKVDDDAQALMGRRLRDSSAPLATASVAGSSVVLSTAYPHLLEKLALPGLMFVGSPLSGRYRIPLLNSESLLEAKNIVVPEDVEAAIRKATKKVTPVPANIPGLPWTLYPFQRRDVAIASRILTTTGGVLLAAEQGTGKTTQALALAQLHDLWPLLVICPLSAFSSWARQLDEMGRSYLLATGTVANCWEQITTQSFDAVVMSYDRLPAFSELVAARGFKCIIADEIQRIRTPGSKRSRALRALAASVPFRMGLSGTPLTNTVADLLPVGAFLIPGEWPARPSNKDLSCMYPGDPIESVADHLGSMMVRRRMLDTGAKLPGRRDHRVYVDLTVEQRHALQELAAEAEEAKNSGEFDGPQGKFHAFARLHKARQIVNSPHTAGVSGPNPKVTAAINLVEDFIASGRKGVVFCADRATFKQLGEELTKSGIGWVGLWGSTPPAERIANEARFHKDPKIKVVLCTIQAGAESWTASPTATFVVITSYLYSPSQLAQAECRAYRLNSDPDGPQIDICYLHAQAPQGTLDDRMWEILETKRQLIAQVVDRTKHADESQVHYSIDELLYMLTGKRADRSKAALAADSERVKKEEVRRREHAKDTLHRKKVNKRLGVT